MTWIATYTGVKFDLANPQPGDVRIADISHALGLLNRWAGHTKVPYSVAQHSCLVLNVAMKLDPSLTAAGKAMVLLHDAHEAYTGDLPSPLKELLPGLSDIQRNIQEAIHASLGLPTVVPEHVRAVTKLADLIMLEIERQVLMEPTSPPWEVGPGAAKEVEPYKRAGYPPPTWPGGLAAMRFNMSLNSLLKQAREQ